jgi:hypothetical protein
MYPSNKTAALSKRLGEEWRDMSPVSNSASVSFARVSIVSLFALGAFDMLRVLTLYDAIATGTKTILYRASQDDQGQLSGKPPRLCVYTTLIQEACPC